MKKAACSYEVSSISAIWMVFSESWKRSCSNFYAHDCKSDVDLTDGIGQLTVMCCGQLLYLYTYISSRFICQGVYHYIAVSGVISHAPQISWQRFFMYLTLYLFPFIIYLVLTDFITFLLCQPDTDIQVLLKSGLTQNMT